MIYQGGLMNDIGLFRIEAGKIERLSSTMAPSEKALHALIERNLETFFDIRLLGREYPTGRTHRGYIDSIGIDGDRCPVIIEYKRRTNENILSQGLFYLDWLLDHKAEFTDLVKKKLGEEAAGDIEFEGSRILCIAASFSRFDERAIMQINRSIELVKYEFFGEDLLLLERTGNFVSPFVSVAAAESSKPSNEDGIGMPVSLQSRFKTMNTDIERLYLALLEYGEQLGEDVSVKFLKHYVAFQREKNFTCLQPGKTLIKLWLNLEPEDIELEEGFSRNVRDIGHHASGNLEIDIKTMDDVEKAKSLIFLAYSQN